MPTRSADQRRRALEEVRLCAASPADLATRLRRFPWDWEAAPLVTITPADVVHVLEQVERGAMTPEDAEAWAELLEFREDVGFQQGEDGPVRQAVHVLANPVLEGRLTRERLAELRESVLNAG